MPHRPGKPRAGQARIEEHRLHSEGNIHLITLLGKFPLFARLATHHLAELAQGARCSSLHRDQAIYRVGDPVSEIYLLTSGQVKLALSCNRGTETILDIIDAGNTFGEAELFGQRPCSANAIATKPSHIVGIARDSLFQVMAVDPGIALYAMKILAQRQIDMEMELAARQTRSAPQRLLDYLLNLAGAGRAATGETLVTLDVSKQLLAARFGMQPESLSRTLRTLVETGLIEVTRSQIRLQNASIERHLAAEAAAQAPAVPDRSRRHLAIQSRIAAHATPSRSLHPPGAAGPLCDSINQAGRQRMLSQRMAKSWLMMERGVLSRRSRLILRHSMAMFDHNLRELEQIADSAELRSAHADLSAAWRPYQALLEAEPGRKAARELFRVNEEVLRAAQALTLALASADGTHRARLVNRAGRERMLSQRMAKFFLFRRMGIQEAKCRAEIEAAHEEFSSILAELATLTPEQPLIAGELNKVAKHWVTLRSALNSHGDGGFAVAATRVFTSSEHLLHHMDAAVGLYVKLPEIARH